MTSAVVHHAAFRRERSVVAVIVGILLPVVRIFQRVRIGLISSEISRRRRRSFCRPRSRRRQPLHHRQSQHFALDRFKFRGIPLGIRRDAAQFVDFLFHTFDSVLGIRMVGKKLRRILPLALGFELLEKLPHGARVVAAVIEHLRAHHIRLRFGASRVTQQHASSGKRAQLAQ